MLPIESLTTFLVASALLTIAPGPDNLFVLTQSALHGRRAGILITLGLCSGLVVHTSAVALGVAMIFQASETAFTILKILGAAYLLYLAWQAFHASKIPTQSDQSSHSDKALYLRGILMNLTNPKVSIFFLAFLPQFTSPNTGSMSTQLLLLGVLFICVALTLFSLIAILAGTVGARFAQSTRTQRLLNQIAGIVFTGLALRLILSSHT